MTDDLDPALVERAALAAYEEAYGERERHLHPWDIPWVKQAWLEIARAALAAAREGGSPLIDDHLFRDYESNPDGTCAGCGNPREAHTPAPTVTAERVSEYADRIESAGRVYGYAVAADLRALLSGEVREP